MDAAVAALNCPFDDVMFLSSGHGRGFNLCCHTRAVNQTSAPGSAGTGLPWSLVPGQGPLMAEQTRLGTSLFTYADKLLNQLSNYLSFSFFGFHFFGLIKSSFL